MGSVIGRGGQAIAKAVENSFNAAKSRIGEVGSRFGGKTPSAERAELLKKGGNKARIQELSDTIEKAHLLEDLRITPTEKLSVSDASKLAQLEKMAAKNPALAREANAAELTRLKSLEASKLTSAQLERIAFLERAQMSVPKRIGSSLGSTPGVMWTSSIAIGVLTMIPWFMSMAKKHDADPNAAADDPLGLADLLGPELAAIAPQLLVSLPFCLLCCCVFFVMMMMAMMAGSGSANS